MILISYIFFSTTRVNITLENLERRANQISVVQIDDFKLKLFTLSDGRKLWLFEGQAVTNIRGKINRNIPIKFSVPGNQSNLTPGKYIVFFNLCHEVIEPTFGANGMVKINNGKIYVNGESSMHFMSVAKFTEWLKVQPFSVRGTAQSCLNN